MVTQPILQYLRDETKLHHDRIERVVDLPRRLSSLASYKDLLVRFYGFYKPLETRLVGFSASEVGGLDLSLRYKSPLLRADLTALGYSPPEVESLPVCGELPAMQDTASVFGCLYVLEGATLGGQMIRREVQRSFGLQAGTGCSFFTSYGDRVGEMWSSFCSAVTDYQKQNPGSHRPVGLAASETFTRLHHWIERGGAC
jgi:heme oxygenase (biliverdin-IX-beta and delta-forming)